MVTIENVRMLQSAAKYLEEALKRNDRAQEALYAAGVEAREAADDLASELENLDTRIRNLAPERVKHQVQFWLEEPQCESR